MTDFSPGSESLPRIAKMESKLTADMEELEGYFRREKAAEKVPDTPVQLSQPDLCHELSVKQSSPKPEKAYCAGGPIVLVPPSIFCHHDEGIKKRGLNRSPKDPANDLDKEPVRKIKVTQTSDHEIEERKKGPLTGDTEQTPQKDEPEVDHLKSAFADFKQVCDKYTAVGKGMMAVQAARSGRMDRAISLWQESSELGYGKSQFNLAVCYETGQGVQKDLSKAIGYYHQAAEKDHATALYNLALLYNEGVPELPQDTDKALALLADAAKLGLPAAQETLDMCNTEEKVDVGKAEAQNRKEDFNQIVSQPTKNLDSPGTDQMANPPEKQEMECRIDPSDPSLNQMVTYMRKEGKPQRTRANPERRMDVAPLVCQPDTADELEYDLTKAFNNKPTEKGDMSVSPKGEKTQMTATGLVMTEVMLGLKDNSLGFSRETCQ